MTSTELLVGTKKGLFVLRGDPASGEPFEIATRAFAGDVVEFAMRDPRTGRYFASHHLGFYGPRLMYTDDDPPGEWTQAEGPAFPEDGDATLERIWMVKPGEADGLLYAGVAPAALFISTDDGESWSLNEPLWKEHQAGDWQPGAGGLALHSICPWPGDPQRLAVGVSAAGRLDHRRRRTVLALRLHGHGARVHARGSPRGHQRALRAQHAPSADAARATVHAVPRQRLPQRRRGLELERDPGRACRAASASRWPSTPPIPTAHT